MVADVAADRDKGMRDALTLYGLICKSIADAESRLGGILDPVTRSESAASLKLDASELAELADELAVAVDTHVDRAELIARGAMLACEGLDLPRAKAEELAARAVREAHERPEPSEHQVITEVTRHVMAWVSGLVALGPDEAMAELRKIAAGEGDMIAERAKLGARPFCAGGEGDA